MKWIKDNAFNLLAMLALLVIVVISGQYGEHQAADLRSAKWAVLRIEDQLDNLAPREGGEKPDWAGIAEVVEAAQGPIAITFGDVSIAIDSPPSGPVQYTGGRMLSSQDQGSTDTWKGKMEIPIEDED